MRALVLVAAVWALAAVAQLDGAPEQPPATTVAAPQVSTEPVTPEATTTAPGQREEAATPEPAAGPEVREPSADALAQLPAAQQPGLEVGFGGSAEEGQPEAAPATEEQVRALQQQLQTLTETVDAAAERIDALETQVQQNQQQAQVVDESIEPRSVRANQQAQEDARRHRVGNLERAVLYMQQVQDRISGGDLEALEAPLTAAAAELQDAAAHAQLATPQENEHLVRAQQGLGEVWPKMSDRNSQYASISLLAAQMEASQALALARSQGHMNR